MFEIPEGPNISFPVDKRKIQRSRTWLRSPWN